MTKIPTKVSGRLGAGLKRFQPILDSARARDVSEADTVTIVKDVLAEVLGYDKYSEVTSEHLIRGTYCDLAVKLDGKLAWLIEVKAAGLDLKDSHVKQAVDYAANQGCEWVALTNGHRWMVFRVAFAKPIEHHLIADIDVSSLNPRKDDDLLLLWLLSKEGWLKSHLEDFAAQQEALSKYTIGALLLSEPVLSVVRRELRRISPEARIASDQINAVLQADVIKREILEGERAAGARKLISRAAKRALRAKADEDGSDSETDAPSSEQTAS
jgi:predicted type IV restriction endonuclease